MEKENLENINRTPTVIISDNNDLLNPLIDKLLKSDCRVDLIKDKYLGKVDAIKEKNKKLVKHLSYNEATKNSYKYLITCLLLQDKKIKTKDISKRVSKALSCAKKLLDNNKPRCVFIFPYVYNKNFDKSVNKIKEELVTNKEIKSSSLFLGQLVGKKASTDKDDQLLNVLKQTVASEKVYLIKNSFYYPISINKATSEILKSLFSFRKKEAGNTLISKVLSESDLVNILKRFRTKVSYVFVEKENSYKNFSIQKSKLVDENVSSEIRKTWKNIVLDKRSYEVKKAEQDNIVGRKKRLSIKLKRRKKKIIKAKKDNKKLSRLQRAVLITIFILLLPLILLLVNISFLYIGRQLFNYGLLNQSKVAYAVSKNSIKFNNSYLNLAGKLPVINEFNSNIISFNNVLYKAIEIEERQVIILNQINLIAEQALNEEIYDIQAESSNLNIELDYLQKELGFFVSEVSDEEKPVRGLIGIFIDLNQISSLKSEIPKILNIVNELPILLGEDSPQTYLIVYQDNSVLRSTGGRIESVALITFNKGRLVETSIYDADFIDSQITGFIEPPEVIRKHLGDSWSIKDSNWDADYVESAKKASWFMDKAIQKQINGVITIDNNFIYELIYQKSSSNLKSVETIDFLKKLRISGKDKSDKEVDYHKEILEASLKELYKKKPRKRASFIKMIPSLIDRKDLLIYLNNISAQRAVEEVGASGALPGSSECDNCYRDWIAVIETNLNSQIKSSDITKYFELETEIQERITKKRLLVVVENKSNNQDDYLANIRVLTKSNSSFSPITVFEEQETKELIPTVENIHGHTEAGIVVEIQPQETKSLLFSWESPIKIDFSKSGEYSFLWHKQPGINSVGTNISFRFPKSINSFLEEEFSLTRDKTLDYNTELLRDFVSLIYW